MKKSVRGRVYSPDLKEFEFAGTGGIFNVIASFVVGPIRLLSRTLYNVCLLSATQLKEFARALLGVSSLLFMVGVVQFLIERKWPLVVSQIPIIIVALYLVMATAKVDPTQEKKKAEVEIDFDSVEELCNTVYSRIENALEEE